MSQNATDSWEPIHNPYIVGNPIKGRKMFFGREDDFSYIKTKFSGGKDGGLVVLCGARRSGKTSILFQILDGRLGDAFLPVLVDMQSMAVGSDADFLRKLRELILSAAEDAGIGVRKLLAGMDADADLGEFVERLSRELGDRKLVLAFDEYELIETNIDAGSLTTQVLHTLSSVIEHHDVFVVFTGSDKLEERNKKYWDIFLSKALHRRISFLSPDDTLRLVNDPVQGSVDYAPGVPERITELTAGQPFYTQVVCQSVVDYLNDERRNRVELDDIDRVVDEVIENPLPQMIFHWNALSELERLSLSVIAELTRDKQRFVETPEIVAFAVDEKLGYRIDPNAASKTLERLFHGDLARKAHDSDAYTFKMDLWRLWSMRMHSVWKVVNEIEQDGGPGPESGIVSVTGGAGRKRIGLFAAVGIVFMVLAGFALRGTLFPGADTSAVGPAGTMVAPQGVGLVDVTTEPADADVWINDQLYGRSPLEGHRAPAGTLSVRIEKNGYAPFVRMLTLAKDSTLDISATLVGLLANIELVTNPPGADVHVDGSGTKLYTPTTLQQLSVNRSYRVRLSLEGYTAVMVNLTPSVDSLVTYRHDFSRRRAPLTIASVPPGAEVFVDGDGMGPSPVPIPAVEYGLHTVRLTLDGYEERSVDIQVPVANDNRVTIRLDKLRPGVVRFSLTPFGDVVIDGQRVAQAVQFKELTLDPGMHQIELRHPEFGSHNREVHVESGDTVRVVHNFSG